MAEKKILSGAFLKLLEDNGIIPENTRRVIIDADYNNPVIIYVEKFGGTKLLDPKVIAALVYTEKLEEVKK